MLRPGPGHPITLETADRKWRARYGGHVFADTDDAIVLREAGLPPVVYFPRGDVAMEYMARTDHHTTCPYKGEASYYTLRIDRVEENVAWSYEEPYDAVGAIAGMIAFDDRVEVYDVTDPRVPSRHNRSFAQREDVDEVIQHTDAGDGTTQREHWAPNVETPGSHQGGVR